MSPSSSSSTSSDLAACFKFEASVPGGFEGAEVHLLSTQSEVELSAEFAIAAPLPAGVREVSREIIWSAEGAAIRPDPDAKGSAILTPPEDSRTLRVKAKGTIKLEPGGHVIEKSLDFVFISPILHTAMHKGIVNGYEVGEYPPVPPVSKEGESKWPSVHPDRYQVPFCFYRVGQEEKALHLSRHITLGHYVIDYPWGTLGMPQYIAVDFNLIEKLEALIDLINVDGKFKCTGLTPIYGFRPPAFNRRTIEDKSTLNLKVPYSMHQYGRAMDFIIDEDGDLVMDDLNGDGKHDLYDAAQIMHYVNILDRRYRSEGRHEMVGGAGIYEFHDFAGRPKTPYIHVDTRGFTSDDGSLIRWKEPAPSHWPDGTPIQWGKL